MTITAATNTKTYDGTTTAAAAPTVTGTLYSIDGATLSESYATANAGTGLTLNPSASFGGANGGNNYTVTYVANTTGVINPAALTYVADPSTQFTGVAFSAFTGTVIGFVNAGTLSSATTGSLLFSSPATPQSAAGTYGIYGSGLTANNGDYVFVQAAGNSTALTLQQSPSSGPSQFRPPANGAPTNTTSINFQTLTSGNFSNSGNAGTPIHITFTPNNNTNVANNQDGTNINPGALPAGDAYAHNRGLDFRPICECDANQYSGFKLPDYVDEAGKSTIFTIIARAVEHDHAADYMIDGFWKDNGPIWPAPGKTTPGDKVTFSDGAGHSAAPTSDKPFPILPGQTDFTALLKNGPVMIGGKADQNPPQWLLALNIAPDGKSIICDDPITGKLVELAYNPVTETLGGMVGIFDPKTNSFVTLAGAGGDVPAGAMNGLAAVQNFEPSTYFAVTIH